MILKTQSTIVTGAGRGSDNIAMGLAREEANVMVVDSNPGELAKTWKISRELGSELTA
jgi:Trk K+ transport system NAD-binding subunit